MTKKGRSAYHYTAHIMQKVKYLHYTTSKRMESIRENILNITGNYGNEHFTAHCRSQQEKGKKKFCKCKLIFTLYSILKTLTICLKRQPLNSLCKLTLTCHKLGKRRLWAYSFFSLLSVFSRKKCKSKSFCSVASSLL